jgi:hypothetical protein
MSHRAENISVLWRTAITRLNAPKIPATRGLQAFKSQYFKGYASQFSKAYTHM